MSRRHLLACLALLLVAAPSQAQVPHYEPFELAVGGSVEIIPGGLLLGFTGVSEDSRCPIDLVCVWEGNAAVDLLATLPGEEPTALQVHTSMTVGQQHADVGAFRVMLLAVMPERVHATGPIDPGAYVVQLMVVPGDVVHTVQTVWGSIKALYR